MSGVEKDARSRALRTFAQGMAVDVLVAVCVVLVTALGPVDDWGGVQWSVLGFTLAKTVVTAAASYVTRRFVDRD